MHVPQGCQRIGQVLQHVKHHDQREPALWLKTLVERPDVNVVPPRASGRDKRLVRLDAADLAVSRKSVEKQPVAATDVQDRLSSRTQLQSGQLAQYEPLAGPPPPMALVELAVLGGVIGLHGGAT